MSLFIICNFADMKKTNRDFLFFLFNMSCLLVGAQVRPMTIDEVDSLASRCNLQLEAARFELNAAEKQLVQAKKRDNPELQLMHNVQNPINRKWFDVGYDGQTELQIDIDEDRLARYGVSKDNVQSIIEMAIGGKAASQVYEDERKCAVKFSVRDRDMGNAVDESRAEVAKAVKLPPGYKIF